MRHFSSLIGIMMFVFADSLCVGSNASAQGQGWGGKPAFFSWYDNGYGAVSTTGSIQIGDGGGDCDSTTAGTIRFTGTGFEGCHDGAWVSLSSSESFVCGRDKVEDEDGNRYKTVRIGNQCWMAENLNVGTMIDEPTDMLDNQVVEKYCYDNDETFCATDGGLYQWGELMQYTVSEGARGICPTGWHVPSDDEWKEMEVELGMTQEDADKEGIFRGTDEGDQLKRLEFCAGGVKCGVSGFEAEQAGFLEAVYDGPWSKERGEYSVYWTSTASGPYYGNSNPFYNVKLRMLVTSKSEVLRTYIDTGYAFSVRCIKN